MVEKRIYRPKEFEMLIEKLIEQKIFETKQAVMMFAAATGWYIKRREPRGQAGEVIRWDIFETNNDDCFVLALALAETQSLEILGRDRHEIEEDPTKVFEEYAKAGLRHIKETCFDAPGDLFDNFLSLINRANNDNDEDLTPNLDNLTPEDLDLLLG
jgi:dnd system-associated protein 4